MFESQMHPFLLHGNFSTFSANFFHFRNCHDQTIVADKPERIVQSIAILQRVNREDRSQLSLSLSLSKIVWTIFGSRDHEKRNIVEFSVSKSSSYICFPFLPRPVLSPRRGIFDHPTAPSATEGGKERSVVPRWN